MINKSQYNKIHTSNLNQNEADRKWRLFEDEQAAFHMQISGSLSPSGEDLTPPVPPSPGSALTILQYAGDQGPAVNWGDAAGTTFTLDPTLPNYSYILDTPFIPQGPPPTPVALIGVTIGNTVVSIDTYAFNGCSLLSSLTFETISTLTSIGNYAFLDCPALTSITIPNSVTIIGDGAFANNTGVTSVTFDPISALTDIGLLAFSNLPLLTSITIPNSVIIIGNGAFQDNSQLSSVIIGNSVASIGLLAFANDIQLTSITIPNSVTSIGSQAFVGSGLTTVAISSAAATGLGITSPSPSQVFFGVTVQTILP